MSSIAIANLVSTGRPTCVTRFAYESKGIQTSTVDGPYMKVPASVVQRSAGATPIVRSRLLNEFDAVSPRLVVLAAPAGYGKSTLARQIAARFTFSITCDCADIDSVRGLWYDVLTAIHQAAIAAGVDVTGQRAGAAADPTLENVLRLLGELACSCAIVFENVEKAFAEPELRRALQSFVGASPRSCTTLLCSRSGARLRLSKFAAPHETLVWRARDLAFDLAEIAQVFADAIPEPQILKDVNAATFGWPVAVLFLQRFVNRIGIVAALRQFDKPDFEQLHEYLIDEVLAELSSAECEAVLACSLLPNIHMNEIAGLLPEIAPSVFTGLVEVCPLFTRLDAERFELHPLLKVAVLRRFAEWRRELGATMAARCESGRRFVRAAQIYRAIGDTDAMARALITENTNPERTRTIEYAALLATLDETLLAEYPVLEALTIYWRRFRVDPHALREQTELVWQALSVSASLELRANVGSTIARLMYETGAFEKAERLLRSLETEFGGISNVPATAGQAYVARTLGCIAARSGSLAAAERYFRAGYLARPGAEHVRSRYFIERALIERLNGNSADEERLIRLALDSARQAQAPVQAVCALAEGAFGAWFRGDDDPFRESLVRLNLEAHANNYVAFNHFCAVGNGVIDAARNGTEQPNWLACTLLVAAAASVATTRITYARAAKDAADESHDVFLQVLACVAVALSDPDSYDDLLSIASSHAARIESPQLQIEIDALARHRDPQSILRAFVGRFRAVAEAVKPALRVEVLKRRVLLGEKAIDVGERQVALLIALARETRTYSRASLTEELWPALAEAGAREALNSCVYRLRSRLGTGIVVFERDAYRLGEAIRVDLRDLEQASALAQRPGHLSAPERASLEVAVKRWGLPATDVPEMWEFLVPTLFRAAQMTQIVAERVALDALSGGTPERALAIARELIASDPCDEQARDIAIRALLSQGDRSSALLELRTYQKVLWRELEVRPSAALTALLEEASSAVAPHA